MNTEYTHVLSAICSSTGLRRSLRAMPRGGDCARNGPLDSGRRQPLATLTARATSMITIAKEIVPSTAISNFAILV